jgi:alkylation response protein AidB-like acyl-CoA dehydrogenase
MTRFSLAVLFTIAAGAAQAAELTEMETRWLSAGAPVLAYAKELKLPIDIVVQPQAGPNDVPLAMGFQNGRCKLVLSMRGNPEAEAVLANVPASRHALLIEAMTAHEVGHCYRYAQGSWHALPSGFVEAAHENLNNPRLEELSRQLRETRREEAYSDLVALAWTQQRHPQDYGFVHGWLNEVRQPVDYGSHNTAAWLGLANKGTVFASEHNAFEQAARLWQQGLESEQ